MPTTRKRHTITETDAVERALAPLRAEGEGLDFAELVIRGAEAKLAELERRRVLREQFLQRTRSAHGLDLDAALAVRERGWTAG